MRQAYDQWAPTYDSSPNPQIVLEFPDVLGLLAPLAEETVLDAACGTGRYTAAIAERGAAVIGLDFSTEMLAMARRRGFLLHVRMEVPAEANIIVGQSHFIKTVEDLFEAVTTPVPQARFAWRSMKLGSMLNTVGRK